MRVEVIVVAVAVLVALASLLFARRARKKLEGRVEQISDGLGYSSELASSLEPETVIDRMLDAMVALPGVDAALVAVGNPADPTTRSIGLTEDEVERTLMQIPAHADLRALEISYRYGVDEIDSASRLPQAALAVALKADGGTIGSMAAITRTGSPGFPEPTAKALDALGKRAGPAIANALRFNRARAQAELDSLTGLYNRRLFNEFLAREIAAAHRYERFLSLIVFDLDDFKRINDRIGHLGGDAVLCEVADRVRMVVRATDIACRVGGDEFAVILRESNREDAALLSDRIGLAIRSQKVAKVGAVKISAGVAELRQDDTATDLFKRADQALYRAKNAGKGRTMEN